MSVGVAVSVAVLPALSPFKVLGLRLMLFTGQVVKGTLPVVSDAAPPVVPPVTPAITLP